MRGLVQEVDPHLLQVARDAWYLAWRTCDLATSQDKLPRGLYDDLRRSTVHTAVLAAEQLLAALKALEVKG